MKKVDGSKYFFMVVDCQSFNNIFICKKEYSETGLQHDSMVFFLILTSVRNSKEATHLKYHVIVYLYEVTSNKQLFN